MSQSAFIKLVDGSEAVSLNLDEVKELLHVYKEQTSKTGEQLDWEYAEAAFPYTIETKPEGEGKWFYLKGVNELYNNIVIGIGSEEVAAPEPEAPRKKREEAEGEADESSETKASEAPKMIRRHYIQVVLPDNCTHGDKAKGNEFCKYIAQKLKAELHLFNGRVMYYNPRK